jgi:hyperosmotically inducible protein
MYADAQSAHFEKGKIAWVDFAPEPSLNSEGKTTMNTKLVTTGLLAAALMLPLAGYTADGDTDRTSPKAFVKDSIITTKIKAKLFEEKMSSLLHIRVDTDKKGVVALSGTAESKDVADKAVAIARSVKGVKSVQNTIEIKPAK